MNDMMQIKMSSEQRFGSKQMLHISDFKSETNQILCAALAGVGATGMWTDSAIAEPQPPSEDQQQLVHINLFIFSWPMSKLEYDGDDYTAALVGCTYFLSAFPHQFLTLLSHNNNSAIFNVPPIGI